MDTLPPAVQSCHDLLLWLIPKINNFPRNQRFTLGERLETGFLIVLENLVQAAYTYQKQPLLSKANTQLAVCRHLWRLCYELKVINMDAYRHGAQLTDNVGRQVGGWLKIQQNRR